MRTAARQDDARPRGKPQAYVDSDGYVYPTKRSSGMPTIIFICMGFALLGALAMMNHFQIPYSALREPLPTANVPTRTAMPTAPYAPPLDAPMSRGGATDGSAPTSDYGIPAYNAQKATEAAQEAPGGAEGQDAATDAEIDAWLAAPVSTPTPLPEPGSPGFAASFEDAPACSPFIGYLPGDPCIAVLAETATAGE